MVERCVHLTGKPPLFLEFVVFAQGHFVGEYLGHLPGPPQNFLLVQRQECMEF